jgi:hypothetical protein
MTKLEGKLAIATTLAIFSLGAAQSASAQTMTFILNRPEGAIVGAFQGTFSGEDSNSDRLLELSELSSFDVTYSQAGKSDRIGLEDLSAFTLRLSSRDRPSYFIQLAAWLDDGRPVSLSSNVRGVVRPRE